MRWFHVVVLVAITATRSSADKPAPHEAASDRAVIAPSLDLVPAISTDGAIVEHRHQMSIPTPPYNPGLHCSGCRPSAKTWERVVGTMIAASPAGFLARGVGSFLTNDSRTAKRLAKLAGIGMGLVIAGGVPAGVSGGNPYLLIPFVPMMIAGTGMFMQTWAADIFNAAGVDEIGQPRARTPWALEAGVLWTHDAYRDRVLFRGAARVASGRLEFGATAYVNDTQQTYLGGDLSIGVRLLGCEANGWWIDDGSYLLVRGIARLRDDNEDNVQVTTGELELAGRLDLYRVANVLDGSFAEMALGGGMERAVFAREDEKGGLLLGRFGYGVYLGRRGEAQLFYDHRRDGFAGGIAAYRAAGFMGSVGAIVDLRLAGRWAMRAELEIGSAWVSSLGLRYQGGPT
ncbi:MAG: hypothetical protein ACKV2T_40165 [Kofleriaceae bacterium]